MRNVAHRKILVSVLMGSPAGRRQLAGIFRYISGTLPWDITVFRHAEFSGKVDMVRDILREGVDGIITSQTVHRPEIAELIKVANIPLVAIDFDEQDELLKSSLRAVRVDSDDYRAGFEGAQHLFSLGIMRSYGFVLSNTPHRRWASFRLKGAQDAILSRKLPLQVFDDDLSKLAKWIDDLPKPTALMTESDALAARILATCHEHHLAVPKQVVLLGSDNDELVCENLRPRLSSVWIDHESEGYVAAKTLDKLMRSCKTPTRHILIPPKGIIARETTSPTSPASSLVERALSFIRERARDGITVDDVVSHTGVSRRLLYLRFRETLGQSVLKKITDERLRILKSALKNSTEPIGNLSLQCGFPSVNQAKRIFKSETGVPMRAWRRGSEYRTK